MCDTGLAGKIYSNELFQYILFAKPERLNISVNVVFLYYTGNIRQGTPCQGPSLIYRYWLKWKYSLIRINTFERKDYLEFTINER